jgi:hypothetical protein
MIADNDNPYQPPASHDAQSVGSTTSTSREKSFARGVVYAVPLALFGAFVPFAAFSTIALARWMFGHYLWIDVIDDFRRMPSTLVGASIGCALVFALAALANYTQAQQRAGLLRSIILVGFAGIAGLVVMSIVTVVFNLGPQSYLCDPWLGLRVAIAAIIPCVYAVALTYWRIAQAADAADAN